MTDPESIGMVLLALVTILGAFATAARPILRLDRTITELEVTLRQMQEARKATDARIVAHEDRLGRSDERITDHEYRLKRLEEHRGPPSVSQTFLLWIHKHTNCCHILR